MDYIAVKNKITQIDTLFVDRPIIDNCESLIGLVQTWLQDMGCNDDDFLSDVEKALYDCWNLHYTHSETNRATQHCNIDVFPDYNYRIEYVKHITKLAYTQKDENKN